MGAPDTKSMLEGAVARFVDEVPALRTLNVAMRVELRERGGPAVWRVAMPGPEAKRDPAADARIALSMDRKVFNGLAERARLSDWVGAHERGLVHIAGDANVLKLVARVIELRRARSR